MVQEITTQSWGSRIMSSFFGIIIGIILIIGSFIFIFWNEGHGLHTAKSLQQTQQILIAVPASPIDPKNNLKVIYINGLATTEDILKEPIFGLAENALKLVRKVEMYQWKENVETKTEKEMGGSERTVRTYTYEPVWSENLIDSSKFKEQTGHQNPSTMILSSATQYAQKVTVGDFTLPSELVKQLGGETPIELSKMDLTAVQNKLGNKPIQKYSNVVYVGTDQQSPKIGDLKITMSETLPQDVSVIGQQTGHTLQAYLAPAGQPVILLAMGDSSSQQMIHEAEVANQITTWLFRLISLIMMIIGISLLLRPLVVLADVVPFIGNVIGFGTGLISFVFGLLLWAIGTAIAWFAFRPFAAIGLIACVVLICYFIFVVRKRKPVSQ